RTVRTLGGLAAATLALTTAGCGQPVSPPASAAAVDAVAFVGVTVVPMDRERVLDNHTVLVEDGRISAVGPAGEVEIPEDAQRIDGAGHWLMPGLAEMHAHIPGDRASAEEVLFLYVANGVTTIRGMAGAPLHLELREQTASGDLLGPTIHAAAPGISGQVAPR